MCCNNWSKLVLEIGVHQSQHGDAFHRLCHGRWIEPIPAHCVGIFFDGCAFLL